MAGLILMVYVLSIFWINFHCHFWMEMDIYNDILLAHIMAENGTLFPSSWIFGNQYYVVSTPVLAAFFNSVVQDSVLSMAISSSLMTILCLLSFIWCIRPFVTRKSLLTGLLCIGGGVILGTNAACYISGLQVLYTMASYYACYLIVFLITVGVYLRLRQGIKVPILIILLSFVLNFAISIHSLRQMCILVLPLLLLESLIILVKACTYNSNDRHHIIKEENKNGLFVLLVFFFSFLGALLIKCLNIPANPIIGEPHVDGSPAVILSNFVASLRNVARISGFGIISDGLQYWPLVLCSVIIAALIVLALIKILKKKDNGALATMILLCVISLLGMLLAGTLILRTRDIYYFLYWLLAASAVMYLIDSNSHRSCIACMAAIVLISGINYCYNFIPDFKDQCKYASDVRAFSEHLSNSGVECIYDDASPIVAAYSHDKIVSGSFWLDYEKQSGYLLSVFSSCKWIPLYDDEYFDKALICISNYYAEAIEDAPKAWKSEFYSSVEKVDELTLGNRTWIYYKPKKRIIAYLY